jgi:hypothetical protein
MAWSSAALTRSMIGFGVALGENSAVQAVVCNSGKPASVEDARWESQPHGWAR